MPSDLELLEIEIETLWIKDERGRLLRSQNAAGLTAPHLVIGASVEGWTLAFGSDVPDALVDEIKADFAGKPPAADPAEPPAKLARCEQLVSEAVGPIQRGAGLSYVIPPRASFESDAEIRRSDGKRDERLLAQDLKRLNWSADEWRQLLDGEFGPWAFVMNGDRVVSLCHSARLTARGAEAGVWTDPDHRGKGYAAAATSAWASLLAPSGRHLFYSTSEDNISSQRVAERLGLPLIGWMWFLREPSTTA